MTGAGVFQIGRQLGNWAEADGRGIVAGPDASLLLPNGSRREPDGAWFDSARWESANASSPGNRVPVFAPELVIEVRSPEQRASTQREKMEESIANGVHLGWLIDPLEHMVTIYRSGQAPEVLTNPSSVSGKGPVAGFVRDLKPVFSD